MADPESYLREARVSGAGPSLDRSSSPLVASPGTGSTGSTGRDAVWRPPRLHSMSERDPTPDPAPGGAPAQRLREQLERMLGEVPPESPSERHGPPDDGGGRGGDEDADARAG